MIALRFVENRIELSKDGEKPIPINISDLYLKTEGGTITKEDVRRIAENVGSSIVDLGGDIVLDAGESKKMSPRDNTAKGKFRHAVWNHIQGYLDAYIK
jgi:hypothetical protein